LTIIRHQAVDRFKSIESRLELKLKKRLNLSEREIENPKNSPDEAIKNLQKIINNFFFIKSNL